MIRILLLAAIVAVAASINSVTKSTVVRSGAAGSYDDFRSSHGHRRGADSVSYDTRRTLYHERVAQINAHNSLERSWQVGVNKFADYTDQELRGMLGYKRWARSSHAPSAPSSLLQLGLGSVNTTKRVKSEVDWRNQLASSKYFRDQGSCGSCWAVATVGALEMQAELKSGNTAHLSYQQLVDCVPNPQHCGGTGGCDGATAELAFDYVQSAGLRAEGDYSTCESQNGPPGRASISGWHRLPTNEGSPLMMAIAEHGPAVVSVDGTAWFSYDGGVFAGCQRDAIVNHAVLTLGYGRDTTQDSSHQLYWLIRNSWGESWGENGHIRILRHSADDAYCGIDNDPKQGVGCDGGPSEIPVCGMCGILSDSSHPLGAVVH